jgi:hypothetical protein
MFAAIFSVNPFGSHVAPGRGLAFDVLVAFVVSFLAIRTSARLTRSVSWWPGGVESGGVHLHHLVWGICLLLLAGFISFTGPLPGGWRRADAIVFGIGAGFTLDEFALWVYLKDVYWSEEGRSSVDAVIIAVAVAGLFVLGTQPFGFDDAGSIWGTIGTIAFVFTFVVIAAAKGRSMLAVVGIFIPVVAIFAALRLARPSSIWARRRYDEKTLKRAEIRYASTTRLARLSVRVNNAIGGAPDSRKPR